MEKNKHSEEENQRLNTDGIQNGIVTVNDVENPTPEQRDAYIPKEPDTERLRSERQSVKDANPNAREASGE